MRKKIHLMHLTHTYIIRLGIAIDIFVNYTPGGFISYSKLGPSYCLYLVK